MLRSIAPAILVFLACSAVVHAQDARVRFVFKSPSIGVFDHAVTVSGNAANRLAVPTAADLKPYLVAAQKALAEREGYSERLYGANHYTLVAGKLIESTVTDPASGRVVYTSRDPAEDRAPQPRVVRPIRTFEADEQPDSVIGFAPVASRSRRAAAPIRSLPFLKTGR